MPARAKCRMEIADPVSHAVNLERSASRGRRPTTPAVSIPPPSGQSPKPPFPGVEHDRLAFEKSEAMAVGLLAGCWRAAGTPTEPSVVLSSVSDHTTHERFTAMLPIVAESAIGADADRPTATPIRAATARSAIHSAPWTDQINTERRTFRVRLSRTPSAITSGLARRVASSGRRSPPVPCVSRP
jgi:hypothetical protein